MSGSLRSKDIFSMCALPSESVQGGWSVLMAAVTSRHLGVTQVLVSAGAALNAVNYMVSATVLPSGATCYMSVERRLMVCLCGAQDHHTVLMMATWKGLADIVALLLSAGADIYVRGKVSTHLNCEYLPILFELLLTV
jgi:ankyrin repeat protein